MPAAFLSNVSFFGCRRFPEDRVSGSILLQRGRCALEELSVFCHRTRTFGTSVFLLQGEPGERKPGSGKIKAKLEQMKEMVRFLALTSEICAPPPPTK